MEEDLWFLGAGLTLMLVTASKLWTFGENGNLPDYKRTNHDNQDDQITKREIGQHFQFLQCLLQGNMQEMPLHLKSHFKPFRKQLLWAKLEGFQEFEVGIKMECQGSLLFQPCSTKIV